MRGRKTAGGFDQQVDKLPASPTAAMKLRHSGVKIASELRLSEKSVSKCIERGKKLVGNNKKLFEYLR